MPADVYDRRVSSRAFDRCMHRWGVHACLQSISMGIDSIQSNRDIENATSLRRGGCGRTDSEVGGTVGRRSGSHAPLSQLTSRTLATLTLGERRRTTPFLSRPPSLHPSTRPNDIHNRVLVITNFRGHFGCINTRGGGVMRARHYDTWILKSRHSGRAFHIPKSQP